MAWVALWAGGILSLATWVIGLEHFLEAAFLVFAVTTFLLMEAPRLTRPSIRAYFHHAATNGTCIATAQRSDCVEAGKSCVLFVHIVNAGFNTYRNCICWLTFPSDFQLLEPEQYSDDLDFKKSLIIQRTNNAVMSPPDRNFQSIAPGDVLMIPVVATAPCQVGDYEIKLELACETRWGRARQKLAVTVE
jgi:hypothetical protein